MSLFDSYQFIDAVGIVRKNINYRYIDEDLRALIDALNPLCYLTRNRMRIGHKLHEGLVERIEKAKGLTDILIELGYRKDRGDYILEESSNRQDVEYEVQNFYGDLINIQRRGSDRLRTFLRDDRRSSPHRRLDYRPSLRNEDRRSLSGPLTDRRSTIHHDDHRPSSARHDSSSSSFGSFSNRFEQRQSVQERNDRTKESVRRLQGNLINQYDTTLSSGFIRRKIAQHHFRSINRNAEMLEDFEIDREIDQRMRTLKDARRDQQTFFADEIYIECLIRTNFDTQKALKMFDDDRPVVKPPVKRTEPVRNDFPQLPKPSVDAIQQRADALRNLPETVDNSPDDHRWTDMQHLLVGIKKIRDRYPNPAPDSDEETLRFAKMFRHLSSEISTVVQRLSFSKVETIAREFCEMDLTRLAAMDVSTIRTRYEQEYVPGIDSLFRMCLVCQEILPRSQMLTMFLCSDEICENCLRGYYGSVIPQIRDTNSLRFLACAHCSCKIPENPEDRVMFFMMLGTTIRRLFRDQPQMIDLYDENIFFATRDKQMKNCGKDGCREIFDIGTNTNVGSVRCPRCNFEQCRQCNKIWKAAHSTMSCPAYRSWLATEDPDNPDVQLDDLLERDGLTCPYPDCGRRFIYEAGGCEHYECTECHRPFCANCSSPFARVAKDQECPLMPGCLIKGLHGHCPPNCFREIRDSPIQSFFDHAAQHNIAVEYHSAHPDVIANGKCELIGCERDAVAESGNRLCIGCYKKHLWKSFWREGTEPWDLYYPENLVRLLAKAGITVADETPKNELIPLAQHHLNQNLGRPRLRARREVPQELLTDED